MYHEQNAHNNSKILTLLNYASFTTARKHTRTLVHTGSVIEPDYGQQRRDELVNEHFGSSIRCGRYGMRCRCVQVGRLNHSNSNANTTERTYNHCQCVCVCERFVHKAALQLRHLFACHTHHFCCACVRAFVRTFAVSRLRKHAVFSEVAHSEFKHNKLAFK